MEVMIDLGRGESGSKNQKTEFQKSENQHSKNNFSEWIRRFETRLIRCQEKHVSRILLVHQIETSLNKRTLDRNFTVATQTGLQGTRCNIQDPNTVDHLAKATLMTSIVSSTDEYRDLTLERSELFSRLA
ncbi:hypothetical protein RND71_035346 [Anisodus tanguticus]|uniref:Uncharacterized protein n=1 Tax=Anisodus tanguticus TaxID=243964 RepID=A0AAE1R4C7_9SOLA|nr:hypothetical protein RND71_035346 [Anisodus tanguticus]